MRHVLILTALCSLLLVQTTIAQEKPPFPRPRPDREALGGQTPVVSPIEVPSTPIADAPSSPNAAEAINQALLGPPQPVTLTAKVSSEGTVIPSGLVWRIFSATPDSDGEPTLVETVEMPTAAISLSPGEYLVHVAYGNAQQTQTILVDQSPSAHIVVLEAGGLKLHASIAGEIAIPEEQMQFRVFPEGEAADPRAAIVTNLQPNEIMYLNAGIYHVVSQFGAQNAKAEANLRVEPGLLTEATLYHDAAEINLRLVSEEGGDAIADVEWTIKDANGLTVFSELSAFPTAVLAEGDYTVLARQGNGVFNRDFAVQAGPARELEILTQIYSN